MSSSVHFIGQNVPGYRKPEARFLPCSSISGRAVICSSPVNCKHISEAKGVSLKCASKRKSTVQNANSGIYRRNPDFSRQNKQGFSRGRNRRNEERDGYDNLEDSEMFSSKNGPLLSASSQKFQATAVPGPREKEIVELFRKVQAQLRERAATKEEKKTQDTKVKGKESETVDSLLKLLRKHSVQQGKKSSRGSSSGEFASESENTSPFAEERDMSILDSNGTKKHDTKESQKPISRPKSNFQRRSPVPQVRFQPVYSEDESVNDISRENSDTNRKKINSRAEADHDDDLRIESDTESDAESEFPDMDVFNEISEDEISEIYESKPDDEAEEHNPIEGGNLNGMKLPELRALAKSRGAKGFSKLKKGELIELLSGMSI